MLAGIGLNQCNLCFTATAQSEVIERFIINGEKTAGGAVFRCHVGNRGAIRQRQMIETVAKEFNEFTDHAFLAQHFHNHKDKVGCGGAFWQLSV